MSESWKDDVLATIMECGTLDLSILTDVEYDLCELLETCCDVYGDFNINHVMLLVFEKGIEEIQEAVQERMSELAGIVEEEMTPEEHEEYHELARLDPFADIESYHNFLDTSVYFRAHGEIYRKYMQDALDDFAGNTGYDISS